MLAITNIGQSGVSGLGDSVGAYQRNKLWITSSISHQFWFTRFMEGVHKHVGEIVKQDKALTIEVIHAINHVLEKQWRDLYDKRETCEMGVWFIVGFCTGMRGEELMLIELAGTSASLENMTDTEGYFEVVISGRTKGNQISGSKFAFPCVPITKGKV